jgi:RNA polymerase sigma factor (sigma-70 family)
MLDTQDLVQETLVRTMERLDHVEVRGSGGFQAYVRSAILNRIRDQIRWAARRSEPEGMDPDHLESADPSPLDLAIGAELLDRFERALATLSEADQQLLHLRIELDYDYDEIAVMIGRPSGEAARLAVTRALNRLAKAMGDDE